MINTITELELHKAYTTIYKAQKIAIIPHASPDADAIGAAISTKIILKRFGKTVDTICFDPPAKNTLFLPYTHEFTQKLSPDSYNLLIFVDCGAHYMSKFHTIIPNLFNGLTEILNIDHHHTNDLFGTINLVDSTAASTCQILFETFKKWQFELDIEVAQCLMTGLYFDTGSFKHSNTTPRVLRIAGQLKSYGINTEQIAYEVFKKKNINTLKLWGNVLKNAKRTQKNIISSVADQSDYKATDSQQKDLEGVIDYLNAVPNSKFSVLISDDQKGGIKGSLRTQNEKADLSEIAGIFGGGGHKLASGFRIQGKLEAENYWKIK